MSANRFYLPSSGSAAASPAFSADWEHQQGTRRPAGSAHGATAIAAQAYTPDAADHAPDEDALHVQFVSAPLAAQTFAAQTIGMAIAGLEADANNNLFVEFKVFLCSGDGSTIGGTLLAITRDATELPITTAASRYVEATSTQQTSSDGDRLVFEVGVGGDPGGGGGVQGHNATLRFGDNAASDLPASDGGDISFNPWINFANLVYFQGETPPVTTKVILVGAVGL